jgi:hypothetical protein
MVTADALLSSLCTKLVRYSYTQVHRFTRTARARAHTHTHTTLVSAQKASRRMATNQSMTPPRKRKFKKKTCLRFRTSYVREGCGEELEAHWSLYAGTGTLYNEQ